MSHGIMRRRETDDTGVTERALREGDHYYQLCRYEDALKEYERATLHDPACAVALLRCGQAFFTLNQFGGAWRSFLREDDRLTMACR